MRKFLLVFVLCFVLISNVVIPVQAQGAGPTPQPVSILPGGNVIPFSQLYGNDIQLIGPYDVTSKVFGLPADWQLSGDGQLELDMTVSFNSQAINGAATNDVTGVGGMMTVIFNNNVITSFPVNQNGDISQSITIPQSAMVSQRTDGRMELRLILDSGISCTINQQMTIFIHQSSLLLLPVTSVVPDTSLAKFPYPLYQDTIFPESALVVIPDQPTAGEIQSMLTVAAGISSLTSNNLALDLTTVSQLTPEQQNSSNLILVGAAASMPLLSQIQLPLSPTGSAFTLNNNDDGVVEMGLSAWNASKVVLVVSGNTDKGLEKAAQAVSTGILQANAAPNLAIVQEVQPVTVPITVPVNQTLADLGYDSQTFARGNSASASASGTTSTFSYRFYLPPGQTPTNEANFELAFGHSSLINYDRSGAVINLNGQPIGSIRMSDDLAKNTINKAKYSIPASAVLNGYNRIDIQVTLFPRDNCTVPSVKGLWFTVWPESKLYLPLTPTLISPALGLNLSAYPAPFVLDSSLSTTAFVVEKDSFDTWRGAFRIASWLGTRAKGSIFMPQAFFGDNFPEEERAKHNIIVIGQPSKVPFVSEFNEKLPAPFANDIAQETNLQVTYRIPADSPQGYVQLLQSPWNGDNVIIVAMGNTTQGMNWAASALVDSNLRSRLAGNFAVVNDTQVVTADTRISLLSPSNPAPTLPDSANGQPVVIPSQVDLTPPPPDRPAWVMQGILVSIGLMLFIILFVIITGWMRNRRR